ncbi:NAD(P)/FAD-dependent oxidoreductase [Ideonella sp. YS5]|uniref:NAD(P)/FAD-dependent oxidoreductase n=1 Tax=Ideonella sp. YS5 TaxID=3453714 RepID=UPI003EECC57D
MRIAVIGAGMSGVTTAYELARDGHEVTVFERRGGVAAEGSFAPASVAAAGLWIAHPGAEADAGMDLVKAPGLALGWRLNRWRERRKPGRAARLQCMADLTLMAQQRRMAAVDAHQLEYEHHRGVLALLRTAGHAKRAQALLESPMGKTLPVRWLGPEEARLVEPGLNHRWPVHAALHWPQGETANGRQFGQALKTVTQQLGALFQFQLEVTAIRPAASGSERVELQWARSHEFTETALGSSGGTGATTVPADAEPIFDAAVICSAEAISRLLGRQIGRKSGQLTHLCSVTAPLREPNEAGESFAPLGAVLDPARGVTIARMGERIRVAGAARLGPPPPRNGSAALADLYGALEESFPGAARTAKAHPWVGRQWATADGLPLVGPSGMPGVWLHCGHATQAWAWTPATARLLSDQLAGRSTDVDPAPLAPSRLG